MRDPAIRYGEIRLESPLRVSGGVKHFVYGGVSLYTELTDRNGVELKLVTDSNHDAIYIGTAAERNAGTAQCVDPTSELATRVFDYLREASDSFNRFEDSGELSDADIEHFQEYLDYMAKILHRKETRDEPDDARESPN